VSNLPEEVKKGDIHRFALRLIDAAFGLPQFFRDRVTFKADFDLNASFRISTKKSQTEAENAGK